MTERLPFHFSLSCIGEGNGNPLQCSCLENPRDGGAWWAAVYGVTQSQTRLKRLSSSSRSVEVNTCVQRWRVTSLSTSPGVNSVHQCFSGRVEGSHGDLWFTLSPWRSGLVAQAQDSSETQLGSSPAVALDTDPGQWPDQNLLPSSTLRCLSLWQWHLLSLSSKHYKCI